MPHRNARLATHRAPWLVAIGRQLQEHYEPVTTNLSPRLLALIDKLDQQPSSKHPRRRHIKPAQA
jgi:hypothetical protein